MLLYVGIMLVVIGISAVAWSLSIDTSVATEPVSIGGSTLIPSQRVHNIGLMQQQRNYLFLSAGCLALGIISALIGVVRR